MKITTAWFGNGCLYVLLKQRKTLFTTYSTHIPETTLCTAIIEIASKDAPGKIADNLEGLEIRISKVPEARYIDPSGTYVVLRGNAAVVVSVQTGNLLQDVAADTGNLAEHEEGSGTSEDTEAGGEGTTNIDCQYSETAM
jgi:hypothetical protein